MSFSIHYASLALVALSSLLAPSHREGQRTEVTATDTLVASASFFTGHWSCAGGTPAGRVMTADVQFSSVLDAHFLEVRHRDRAPGRYESVALWPSVVGGSFETVVYDNFGGARHFLGAGTADSVVLVRDTTEARARLETFTYRVTSASSYWYGWHVSRAAGQPLALGDSATCRRA